MKKTQRIITTIMLLAISLSNLATPVSYAAEMKMASPSSTAPTTVSENTPVAPPSFHQPENGSVLGDSTSLFEVGTQEDNQTSASQRVPIRMQKLPKKVYDTDENVTLAVINPDNDPINTSVRNAKGQTVNVPINQSSDGTNTDVQLTGSNEITPGKYTIQVMDNQGNVLTQDFSWGVLAMNFDKDTYHQGETGNISFGVLDDQGSMVCNAELTLHITNAISGISDTLSTNAASSSANIIVNPQCQKHDFSLQPDYQASYPFIKPGTYTMQLTAQTQNGTHSITNTIPVTNDIPFDIQRISATRIYPRNTYPMTINVTAHQDFSGTITETVPQDFVITPATESAQFTSGVTPTSYDDMQTMYLNTQNPSIQLQQSIATTSAGLVMPFQGNYPVTQGFGAQLTDPTLQAFYTQYGLAGHDGVDFGVPMNTSLYAVDDGSVVQAGPGDYGTTIIIRHAWGESYYGHLSNTAVNVGEHVTKGQLIGYSGESGEATGPHLHFGMRPNDPDMLNGYYGKVDPMSYLPYNQAPQSLASLGPTIPLTDLSPVLGASTSASPTPAQSPSPIISPTVALTPEASVSATPAVSQVPTATPSASAQQSTTTITESTTPPANIDISVLDKQILLNEQIANSTQTEKVKVISWNVTLKKGQTTSLGYEFKAPPQSPQFYLLGPLQFYANGSNKVIFQEQRSWQIASDDVGVAWYTNTTNSSWNGYSWQYRKKIDVNHSQVSSNIFSDGFESGNLNNWNGGTVVTGSSNVTVQSSIVKTGTNAAKVNLVSNKEAYVFSQFGSTTNFSVQADIYVASNSTEVDMLGLEDTTVATNFVLGVDSTQHICMWNSVLSIVTCSATTISLNAWHHYQMTVNINSSSGSMQVYYDGTLLSDLNQSNINTGSTPMNAVVMGDGNNNATGTYYVDNLTLSSATPTVTFMDSGGDATQQVLTSSGGFFDGTGGTLATVDSSTSETGPDSLKFIDSAAGSYIWKAGVLASTGRRISAYVKFDSFPASTHDFFDITGSGNTGEVLGVTINSSGVVQLLTNGTVIGSGATLTAGTWYRVSIAYVITSTTNYSATVYINGTPTITYSQTTSGPKNLLSSSVADLYVGLSTPSAGSSTEVEHMDDIYVDTGTDLSDPGDIHVTAKLPIANGATNSYTPQGSANGTPCTTGTHCAYVNERPLNTTDYVQGPRTATTETFTLQGASSGDVDISSDYFIADEAWADEEMASGTTSCTTPTIYNNGVQTTISLTTSYVIYTNIINNTSYPSGNQAVGSASCQNASGTHTINFAEGGMQIAYTTSPPNASLSNFPVLVNLSSDTDLHNHAQSGGGDILFTDSTGENLLPYEIENYTSSTGSLQAWVDISSLSTVNDTIIYMYYGNPSSTGNTTTNAHNTWNSNYGAVWHLSNQGGTLSMADSTSNGNTGTNNGVSTGTGQIDGGATFPGFPGQISVANNNIFNPLASSFSVTQWVNISDITQESPFFTHMTSGRVGWQFYTGVNCGGAGGTLCFYDGASQFGSIGGTLANNTWEQVGFTKSGTSLTFYLNGIPVGVASPQASIPTTTNTEFLGWDPGDTTPLVGILDETDYSTTALSPGWIQTEYTNQNSPSTFYSVGGVETDIYAPLLSQLLRHGQFFGTVGVQSGVIQPFTW